MSAVTRTAILAVALSAIARGSPPVWLRAKGDGFIIYGDCPQKALTEFAVKYAAFESLFREFFLPPGKSLPPAVLVLLDHSGTQRDYLPDGADGNGTVVDFSTVADGVPVMAVSMSGSRDEATARAFEFETIWAVRQIGYYAPIWMAQGAGRVMSTLTVSRGKCRFDDLDEGYGWDYYLRHTALPWPRFFAINEVSPEYTGKTDPGTYHAQALALMDWILLSDSGTRERFAQLSQKLLTMPDSEAIQDVMHVPAGKLSDAIDQHFRGHRRHSEYPFDEATVRAALEVGPADEAEILIQTSNLLAAEGRPEKCRQQLARAEKLAPDRALLKEALARRAAREGQDDEAVRLYREAMNTGSTDPFAYLASARARLDGASAGGNDWEGRGGPNTLLAVEETKKAIALSPGNAVAFVQLGRAYYVAPEAKEEMIADLDQGLQLTNMDWRVRFYRGLLNGRLGRMDAEKADFGMLLGDTHLSESDHQQVRVQLAYLHYVENQKTIQALVEGSKFSEARKLADEAEKQETDPAAAKRYRELAVWIDRAENQRRPR